MRQSQEKEGEGPLVETQVRRSGRIREENKGFKRNSCSGNSCLPCNVAAPVLHSKVVKNLTTSFCKVAEEDLQEKLAKRPKKKEVEHEELAKVSEAKENNSKDSSQ